MSVDFTPWCVSNDGFVASLGVANAQACVELCTMALHVADGYRFGLGFEVADWFASMISVRLSL